MEKKQILYLDVLRIAAVYFVVVIHVAASEFYTVEANTLSWQIFNLWDAMGRWAVPVCVMISGALFLGQERGSNIKQIYRKNIFRMVTAFLFWSLIYAALEKLKNRDMETVSVVAQVIKGHYHMWYVPMAIGLYILTPLLNQMLKDRRYTEYFLKVSLVLVFLVTTAKNLYTLCLPHISNPQVILLADSVFQTISRMYYSFGTGYTVYFVLGYYLHHRTFTSREEICIYVLSALGFLSTIVLSSYFSVNNGYVATLYGEFNVNVLLQAVGVFVFCKGRNLTVHEKGAGIIRYLGKCTFGCYLAHIVILEGLRDYWGITTLSFHAGYSVALLSLGVFLVSMGLSAVLNAIPVLKRYIV